MFFLGVIAARYMHAQIGESLRCDFHGDDSKIDYWLQVTVRIVQTISRHNSYHNAQCHPIFTKANGSSVGNADLPIQPYLGFVFLGMFHANTWNCRKFSCTFLVRCSTTSGSTR